MVNGPVAMDGMNKTPIRGGGLINTVMMRMNVVVTFLEMRVLERYHILVSPVVHCVIECGNMDKI